MHLKIKELKVKHEKHHLQRKCFKKGKYFTKSLELTYFDRKEVFFKYILFVYNILYIILDKTRNDIYYRFHRYC